MDYQRLEVMDDCREVEFVACTRETSQPHSLEAVMGFQVRKAHLDFFALIAGFLERRCSIERTRNVAGVFIDAAEQFA